MVDDLQRPGVQRRLVVAVGWSDVLMILVTEEEIIEALYTYDKWRPSIIIPSVEVAYCNPFTVGLSYCTRTAAWPWGGVATLAT